MVQFNLFKKSQQKEPLKKEEKQETDLKTDLKEAEQKESLKDSKGDLEKRLAFLIKSPILTEKASQDQALNKYYFLVDPSLNKSEVKKIIEKYYQVKVEKVNILNIKKRPKRWLRTFSRPSRYKKAIVTLKEGYKINIGI